MNETTQIETERANTTFIHSTMSSDRDGFTIDQNFSYASESFQQEEEEPDVKDLHKLITDLEKRNDFLEERVKDLEDSMLELQKAVFHSSRK